MIDRGRWRRNARRGPPLPVEPWSVAETALDPGSNAARESLFALGNGYLGIRGTFEEGAPAGVSSVPGTYLNGFHERAEILYPEDAFGLARVRQTMLNVIDGTSLALELDGERVLMDAGVADYHRTLDLRAGTLTRSYIWRSSTGKRSRLTFLRAVSLPDEMRAGLRLSVEPLDGPVSLRVTHCLDGQVENQVERGDPRVGTSLVGQVLKPLAYAADGEHLMLHMRAPCSQMELVCAATHAFSDATAERSSTGEPLRAGVTFTANLERPATLDVQLVYLDSRKAAGGTLVEAALQELTAFTAARGVSGLLERQREWLESFWHRADVEVEGDPALQQSLRFSLFHLLQGAGRDGTSNIASKALTGEGYEGHTFWDSEIYVVPVFAYVLPRVARALLEYRVGQLPAARARASELHRHGALFPWRTIAGPEASAYYPAGTAQLHINADVAVALQRYLAVTGDLDLMWAGGAEVVFECARFYSHYGVVGSDGLFHLHTVTGPDEYTALVDDNHFTNKMARETLSFAAALATTLRDHDPDGFARLGEKLGLSSGELETFAEQASLMCLPLDEDLAVTPQDASFLGKPEWPWASVPDEHYPLLLHYHPLDIYRHQVLKQADVLLAHYLLPEDVPRWRLRRDADYYASRTTHDSSLSACAHAIVATELNRLDSALGFFDATARTDLDDLQGNGEHGVHVAAMGGTWLSMAHGFAGLRATGDGLFFRPRLPSRWRRLRFRLQWRGRLLEVDLRHDKSTYRLLEGEELTVTHRHRRGLLRSSAELTWPTGPQLRGVIFDLDGVLTDSAELHYRAWQELARDLDIPFDRTANERLRGIDRLASLDLILEGTPRDYSTAEKRELAARKNATYQALVAEVTPGDVLPGVLDLLDELQAAGLPLALASASRNAPALLQRLGLQERFAVVIDPAILERGKPDPEIFERAAAALGFATDECVGVEDAAAGVTAILGAGMTAVGVGSREQLGDAHVVVPAPARLSLDVLRQAHRSASASAPNDRP